MLLAVLAGAAATAGCGGDRPKLGAVTGKVTLDGRPLKGARILFSPTELDRGRESVGFTDVEGNYELIYIRDIRGASIGTHVVRITTANSEEGTAEKLPARYHSRTTLEAEVGRGSNEIDFALTSD